MLLSETTEYNDDDAEAKVKAFKSVIKPSSKFTVKKEGFADMLYVTTKDAIKFKEDKKHYGTLKFLAIALGTIQSKKRHTNCIFTISLRHSGDTYWFEANVPYLEYNTEFESYTYDLYKIRLTEKDVNDKLNLHMGWSTPGPLRPSGLLPLLPFGVDTHCTLTWKVTMLLPTTPSQAGLNSL